MTNLLLLPDGMRRYSETNNISLDEGYTAMADKLVELTDWARQDGLKGLYVATSSAQNFSRPPGAVKAFLDAFLDVARRCHSSVNFTISGSLDLVPEEYLSELKELSEKSAKDSGFTLHFVLGMSLLREIVNTFNKYNGKVPEMTTELLAANAYVPATIDYVIRTSGHNRLSNFYPLMSPYAELHFCDTLFPAMTRDDFDTALKDLRSRDRRYGGYPTA
ncbi:ditrans,polycis-polyprenyl diphosphate synthase [Streptomyces sp. TLI_55]|uniref:undecaprenyl diphosphate synthase family protein n=1 Tax=Streptomyces sp. TLI_55 TaxID=1938861 RepID=UPI000BDC8EED|nr:undecaprenyl diphosphate synthase family protein [Streptomyces sp. TLI_55]SNX88212.1 ditrans,polycis-polyprenyl diphosphate synthase [Streptomyces sp. TLI_55]